MTGARLAIAAALLLGATFALPVPSAHGPTSNLVENGSFEQGDVAGAAARWTTWGEAGAQARRTPLAASDHAWSLAVAPRGGDAFVQSAPIAVQPGATLRAGIDVLSDAPVRLLVTGDGVLAEATAQPTAGWSRPSVDFVVPAGAGLVRILVVVPAEAKLALLDDASLAQPA